MKSRPPYKSAYRLPYLLPLLLLVAGCHRDDVKVYRVAKDQDQPPQQAAPALSTDSPNPALPPGHPDISAGSMPAMPGMSHPPVPQLTWTTPEGWTEAKPTEMRVASFKVSADGKQADVSIIPLPGLAGNDDANVNRWRGQVGLPSLAPEELKKSAEDIEAAGLPAQLYDVAGKSPGSGDAERILGVIQHRDDMAWFYKMTGAADLVEQQKPAFIALLKSLKFSATPAAADLPPAHPPMGGMDMGMGAPAATAPISSEGKPNWQVPAGWQEVSGGQFLVAKFTITGPTGAAAVNVSSSAGEGGGLNGNINRWRGQLGLPQWSDAEVGKSVATIELPGGKASLVDLSGTDPRTQQPTRLVGLVVPQSGQTWFYKLMGESQVVESQKTAFIQFVQGVKY